MIVFPTDIFFSERISYYFKIVDILRSVFLNYYYKNLNPLSQIFSKLFFHFRTIFSLL